MMRNKKGTTMPMQTIVVMVILIAVVVIFIVGVLAPKGLLQKAGRSIGDIMGVLPDTDRTIELKQLPLDKDVRESAKSIVDAFIAAKDANAPCIIEYKPADLNGYILTVVNDESNVQMVITTPDKQVADIRDVKDLKYNQGVDGVNVCVVAGKIRESDISAFATESSTHQPVAHIDENGKISVTTDELLKRYSERFEYAADGSDVNIAAKNFYTNWIVEIPEKDELSVIDKVWSMKWGGQGSFPNKYFEERSSRGKIIAPDYTNPTTITLTGSSTMRVAYGKSEPNDWAHKDKGLLYVPEKGKVCFFSTFYPGLSDYGIEGLEASNVGLLQKYVRSC